MVLPLLFSMGLPALAGSGALGATLGAMSVPALAGIGAGLGSFVQTGDIGKGIQTGMTSFLGGKILGGLSGSTSAAAQGAVQGAPAAAAPTGSFLESITSAGTPATEVAAQGASGLGAKLLGPELAAKPFFDSTIGGAVGLGQQAFMPAMIGQTMTDAQMMQEEYKNRAEDDDDIDIPMPNPMVRTYNPDPYASGGGEGLYFQYRRRPRQDGTEPKYPYYYSMGGPLGLLGIQRQEKRTPNQLFDTLSMGIRGIVANDVDSKIDPFIQRVTEDAAETFGGGFASAESSAPKLRAEFDRFGQPNVMVVPKSPFKDTKNYPTSFGGKGSTFRQNKIALPAMLQTMAEGGEVEVDEMMEENGMNEKDVIVEAIKAIKGMSDQSEIALAMFVQKYGEDALRDLVGRVQSGELDDTIARFAEGDKGMVKGPGDGSGVDDMVPATLEGEQDVLLSDGEFVLRKNTTDALEKEYGGGFLDVINRAEEDAPEKLEQMVG